MLCKAFLSSAINPGKFRTTDSACRTRRNFSTLLLKPGQPTFRHKSQGSHELKSSYSVHFEFYSAGYNRVSTRGETQGQKSSDTAMAALCVILVFFSKLCGLLGQSVVQPNAVVTAQLGDTVTLPCFCSDMEGVPRSAG
ncbi:hypothetical protein COCON_G00043110 [Conger conger]|uniref:Uncharacterized protein n=1 Tax=Conger conger TaxID=82655 RepID=A0A9Q1DTW9_CONCO|nr:hypothetical protein COCON_G00043110 [Conger conger]